MTTTHAKIPTPGAPLPLAPSPPSRILVTGETPDADLVLGGGGSLMPAIAAAAYEVQKRRRVKRVCGTSAGSIAAAAIATGMPAEKTLALCTEMLADDKLLDASFWPFDRWGVFSGDTLFRALQRAFPGTLAETAIPLHVVVCDLWTRRPMIVSSESHPNLPIAAALRASSGIPGFFKAFALSSVLFGNRLFVDGGCAINFAMNEFDDVPDRQTVGVRVRAKDQNDPRPVRDLKGFAVALADIFMWSSDNAHISNKHYATTIDIVTDYDSLNFALPPEEVSQRWTAGGGAAVDAL